MQSNESWGIPHSQYQYKPPDYQLNKDTTRHYDEQNPECGVISASWHEDKVHEGQA